MTIKKIIHYFLNNLTIFFFEALIFIITLLIAGSPSYGGASGVSGWGGDIELYFYPVSKCVLLALFFMGKKENFSISWISNFKYIFLSGMSIFILVPFFLHLSGVIITLWLFFPVFVWMLVLAFLFKRQDEK